MINIVAALEVAGAAASKEDAGQLIADAKLLYGLYQDGQSGKLQAAITNPDSLKSGIAALARTSAVANSLMADKTTAQHISDLLASVTS